MISSYVGEMPNLNGRCFPGELDVELIPQGTLAERCRSAQAGIPAHTPAGYGTKWPTAGVREFNGKMHVMEHAFNADFAIVKKPGREIRRNLIFKGTARNFNPCMAGAAKLRLPK
jgi:3-oxoacid CoA-transferase subunit A